MVLINNYDNRAVRVPHALGLIEMDYFKYLQGALCTLAAPRPLVINLCFAGHTVILALGLIVWSDTKGTAHFLLVESPRGNVSLILKFPNIYPTKTVHGDFSQPTSPWLQGENPLLVMAIKKSQDPLLSEGIFETNCPRYF
jgi:hypothetical protein